MIGVARSLRNCIESVDYVRADLLNGTGPDFASLAPTHIVHAAWITAHPEFWTSVENFRWQASSLALLERFAQAGGHHFTFVGTCAEYDWAEDKRDPTRPRGYPNTLYGASKLLTTQILSRRAAELGIGFTCCRIFFPYSAKESDSRITTLVLDALLNDRPFHMRSGDVLRDIYSTRSAADLIVSLTLGGFEGIFDVSTGKATHLGTFLKETFGGALGREHRVTWDRFEASREDPARNPYRLLGQAQLLPVMERPSVVDNDEIEAMISSRRSYISS